MWVGLALLLLTMVGARWGLNLPASDRFSSPESGKQPELLPRRAVCFGHIDTEQGTIPLYPVQPGRVLRVEVHDNQEVKRGAVLIRMEDTVARETLDEAEADLIAAQAQLTYARSLVDQHKKQIEGQKAVLKAREHELAAARIKRNEAKRLADIELARAEDVTIAEESVKALESTLEAEKAKLEGLEKIDPQVAIIRADADVKVREARVRKAQFALKECAITAPCDGTVLRLLTTVGEALGSNARQPALNFCPAGPRIVRAEIEQEFANRAVPGEPALIQDDTRTSPLWKGKVVRVSDWYTQRRSILMEPLQFNDVRTLECIIELDPTTPPLKIGQRVRVILKGLSAATGG
jgi:multidrug resistance efflux pump